MSKPSDARAMSPVIGGALVLAIVVALAVVTGAVLFGFGDALGAPPPFVASEQSVQVRIGGNESRHSLEFVHRGGDAVDADALTVSLAAGGTRRASPSRPSAAPPSTTASGPRASDSRWG